MISWIFWGKKEDWKVFVKADSIDTTNQRGERGQISKGLFLGSLIPSCNDLILFIERSIKIIFTFTDYDTGL